VYSKDHSHCTKYSFQQLRVSVPINTYSYNGRVLRRYMSANGLNEDGRCLAKMTDNIDCCCCCC